MLAGMRTSSRPGGDRKGAVVFSGCWEQCALNGAHEGMGWTAPQPPTSVQVTLGGPVLGLRRQRGPGDVFKRHGRVRGLPQVF